MKKSILHISNLNKDVSHASFNENFDFINQNFDNLDNYNDNLNYVKVKYLKGKR